MLGGQSCTTAAQPRSLLFRFSMPMFQQLRYSRADTCALNSVVTQVSQLLDEAIANERLPGVAGIVSLGTIRSPDNARPVFLNDNLGFSGYSPVCHC